MSDIFISYRRTTDGHAAGRLRQCLKSDLPVSNIFMDVTSIPPGTDFPTFIRHEVQTCRVLLAVIGPRWLDVRGTDRQRRLSREDDLVRLEIAEALTRAIPVVPVLIDNTPMPAAEHLPNDLKSVVRRHAIEISHATFDLDALYLARRLEDILKPGGLVAGIANLFSRQRLQPLSPILVETAPVFSPQTHRKLSKSPPTGPRTLTEQFYIDMIRTSEGSFVTATELYENYCSWCEMQNREPEALPSFSRGVAELGVRKEKVAGRVRYVGVALNNE